MSATRADALAGQARRLPYFYESTAYAQYALDDLLNQGNLTRRTFATEPSEVPAFPLPDQAGRIIIPKESRVEE